MRMVVSYLPPNFCRLCLSPYHSFPTHGILCNVVYRSFINFLILFFPAGVCHLIFFPYTRPEKLIPHDYVWSLECVFFFYI